MNGLARRAAEIAENAMTIMTVPLPLGESVRFYDAAIVIAAKDTAKVFSSTCPHLGCRINRSEGDQLVCPCHGSRFNLHGELLHGPATRALQPLSFELDRAESVLRITLKP